MFIRKQVKKGKTYYSLVYTYRKDGKVLQVSRGIGTKPRLPNTIRTKSGDNIDLSRENKEKILRNTPELKDQYDEYLKSENPSSYCKTYKCMNPPVVNNRYNESTWCEDHGAEGLKKERKYIEKEKKLDNEFANTMKSFGLMQKKLSNRSMFCRILGVSEDATQGDIKNAYRKIVQTAHPDRGGDPHYFKIVKEAYDGLS